MLSSHLPEVRAAIDASSDDIGEAIAGRITHKEANQRIFARLGALKFLPPYMGFGKPEQHAPATFTLPAGARHVIVVPLPRGEEVARLRGVQPADVRAARSRDSRGGTRPTRSRAPRAALRDVFWAGNDEWKRTPNALRAHGKWATTETPGRGVQPASAALAASPAPRRRDAGGTAAEAAALPTDDASAAEPPMARSLPRPSARAWLRAAARRGHAARAAARRALSLRPRAVQHRRRAVSALVRRRRRRRRGALRRRSRRSARCAPSPRAGCAKSSAANRQLYRCTRNSAAAGAAGSRCRRIPRTSP